MNRQSRDEPIEYNTRDCIIPFKPLRHLPKILKLEDSIIKTSELATLTTVILAQDMLYFPIVRDLLKNISISFNLNY